MKKLGLIGGTGPESTLAYYRDLEYGVQKRLNANVFPTMTIESMSVFDVLRYCDKGDYAGLTNYLLKGVRNLAAAGAQYATFTGITPHVVFNQVADASPIPMISIVDAARDFTHDKGYEKVCLLGTLPTMSGTFFQTSFAQRGIEVVTPTQDEMRYIEDKIETELELGIVVPETQKELARIAQRIIDQDHVQAVVVGCTELPLAFKGVSLPVPTIDVMQVHIDALIDLIVSD